MAAGSSLGALAGIAGVGSSTVGRAVVELVADSSQLRSEFAKTEAAGATAAGTAQKQSVMMANAWKVGALVAGAALVKFGISSVKAFMDAEAQSTQTNAVIAATGGVANVTAQGVENLAGRLQDMTGIEDETIQEGANMLLTFKNIRNEVGAGNNIFDQTVVALTDMSVAIKDAGIEGNSMSSMAIKLGKALNDPVKGVTALTRVGVTFTEVQKAQITALANTGQQMEAQKLILAELRSEFGGSAAAVGQTFAGQLARLGANFNDLQENIGRFLVKGLLPITEGLNFLVDVLNAIPEDLQGFIGVALIGTGVLAGLGAAVSLVKAGLDAIGISSIKAALANRAQAAAAAESAGAAAAEAAAQAGATVADEAQGQMSLFAADANAAQAASQGKLAGILKSTPMLLGLTTTALGFFILGMHELSKITRANDIQKIKDAFGQDLREGIDGVRSSLTGLEESYQHTVERLSKPPETSGWGKAGSVYLDVLSVFSGQGLHDDISAVSEAQMALSRSMRDGTLTFAEYVVAADETGKSFGEGVITNKEYTAEINRMLPAVANGTVSEKTWAAAVDEATDRGFDAMAMLNEYKSAQAALASSTKASKEAIEQSGSTWENFARITGTTAKALRDELFAALKEGPTAVDEFTRGMQASLDEFANGVAATFGDVDSIISDLAGKKKLDPNMIIGSFDKQARALSEYQRNWREVQREVGPGADELLTHVQELGLDGAHFMEVFANASQKEQRRIVGSFGDVEGKSQSLGSVITDDLVPAIEKLINSIRRAAGLPAINFKATADTSEAQKRLTDFIGNAKKLGFQMTGSTGQGFKVHSGGEIPGPKGKEVQATLLTGEYVINPKQTQKHIRLIEAINTGKLDKLLRQRRGTEGAALPKFHAGGPVDRSWPQAVQGYEGLDERMKQLIDVMQHPPELVAQMDAPGLSPMIPTGEVAPAWGGFANGRIPLSAMTPMGGSFYLEPHAAAAFKAAGATLSGVSSMYRSYEQQAGLFATVSGPVAPPGQSMHGWGKAVDATIGSQAWRALDGPGRAFNWRPGTSFGDPVHHSWGHTGRQGGYLRRDSIIQGHKGETITNPRDPLNMRAMADAYTQAIVAAGPTFERAFKNALKDRQFARIMADAMREVRVEMTFRDDKITKAQDRRRTIRSG